jgi:hypothetical protein
MRHCRWAPVVGRARAGRGRTQHRARRPLVKLLGAQNGMHLDVIDDTVALVETRLAENRKKAS